MSHPAIGDIYQALGAEMTIELDSASTGGTMSVVRQKLPAGASPGLHRHPAEHETFVIVKGRAKFIDDGRVTEATAGDTICLVGGSAHAYLTLEPSEWLIITAGVAQFDKFVAAAAAAQPGGGPPDPALLGPVAAAHGIEILGPPPAELRA
jgi:quercetin dioxygenase-like cupin family protein